MSGGGINPTPTDVTVTTVPIVVVSTTDEYFVLYVTFDVDGTEVELPVLVKLGAAGTTTLAENVEALPKERYRVEKYLIADPSDVDGDCVDDITELGDPVGMNPVNPAPSISFSDGAVAVPDTHTYDALAIGGYFKFALLGMDTDRPNAYFINAKTHSTHQTFLDDRNINRQRVILGAIAYRQNLVAPDGSQGVYLYSLNTLPSRYSFSFSLMERTHTLLAASMPLLEDNLALYVRNGELPYIQSDLPLYRESRINLVFDGDVYSNIDFLALNLGEGVGRLQVLDPDDRPHPRDIVLYEALPNELPRVAGIISTVPQTPLSHVNLRAIQDGIPNAYIRDVRDDPAIAPLIGDFVRYEVTEDGYSIRAATKAEVDAHYESSRPAEEQTPGFDLSVTGIKPLSQIGFEDWTAFGVKAANVAVLGTLGFPARTVPDGFAIPFYFYDEFMKAHGFYDAITEMLADEDFQTDFEVQDDMLDDLRDDIEDADSPQWIVDALTEMHAAFPEGTSLRYRSSTNNEDLPNFNGAGLYDSKTQDPEETEEDGIDKSLKGVFASLWTFRAFTEREFHRIDHLAAKMGVLVHPNYSDELANGVAVSLDPIRDQDGYYYVNTQLGEDLVTNPEAHSVPEEILLDRDGSYFVLATSNLVEPGELLMSDAQLYQLRDHLTVIHDHFHGLYNPTPNEPFAMEIEFKITSENILAIKQARPWVFDTANETVTPPPPPPPVASNFPTADAGPDQTGVREGALVMLDGSGSSDPDDDPLRFRWNQLSGQPVVLSSQSIVNPTFTAPQGLTADAVLSFRLLVTDPSGRFDSDTVTITVEQGTSPPLTEEQIYYFPHLAVGTGWQTTITYINYSLEEVSCTTEFLSDQGTPLMVSFAGLGAVPNRTDVLPPDGSVHQETNVGLSAPLAPGWARATCTGPVKASLLFRQRNSEGAPMAEAGVNAATVPATRFVTFAEQGAGKSGTGVAYANPSPTEAVITFTARDEAGLTLASVNQELSAGGHGAQNMEGLFDLASFTGSLEVTSTEPIVTLSLNFEAAPVFSSLPPGELDAAAQGSTTYYFPHLAVGASWQTTITYINYSPQEVSCQTDFLSDHGSPLMVSFADKGTVVSRTDVLLPGGAVHEETNVELSAPLAPGWARATCSGPGKASLLFRQHNSEGLPTAEAAANAAAVPATRFVTFAEQGEGKQGTGVAYANPSDTAAMLTFTARDEDGETLASVVRTLLPGGHDAQNMEPLFGLPSFTGSIEITSTEPIVSLSLNFEAAPVFSSLPSGEVDAADIPGVIPMTDAPDLVVQTPSVDDSSPGTGASFTLSATVSNAGTGESAATTLRYYRSTDATISASDTEVGTDAVEVLTGINFGAVLVKGDSVSI